MSGQTSDLKSCDLSPELRRAPLDEAGEQGTERFVVKRWVERAEHTLKLWEQHPPSLRLACEVLLVWQALARFAPDAPLPEHRAQALEALWGLVQAQGTSLVALGAESFALKAWKQGLAAYEARVGVPSSWDEEDAASARALIEDLDDALLFEAAAEALDVPLSVELADALQDCAVRGAEAAHSLVPHRCSSARRLRRWSPPALRIRCGWR